MEHIATLENILEDTKCTLDHLTQDLRDEREAIIELNLEKLTHTYQLKQRKLIHLQSLDRERINLVREIGNELGKPGLSKIEPILGLMKDTHQADRLREQISCIRSLSQAITEFNDIQREYLTFSLHTIRNTLSVMDKCRGEINSPSYNNEGKMNSEGTGKQNRLVNQNV